MQHDLVGVFQLMIVPLFLGSGRRWFGDGRQVPLALTEARTTAAGVVTLTYEQAAQLECSAWVGDIVAACRAG